MLFEALEGKRSEDLATEVLAFLLQSSSFGPLQRLIYQWILEDGLLQSTEERDFEVRTQETYPGQGRLDITIVGDGLHVIVESKFDAEFSQGDQLSRYVSILKGRDEKLRLLVLLCPERSRLYYEGQALTQFHDIGAIGSLPMLQHELLSQFSISFKVLTWDRLLVLLQSDSVVIAELITFVRNRALTPVEFSARELSMMMGDEVPKLLMTIFQTIDQVGGRLGSDFVVQSWSRSPRYHASRIIYQGVHFWFGYSLEQWSRLKTPFSLQFKADWAPANSQVSQEKLLGVGFDKIGAEFIYPLLLTDGNLDPVLSLAVQIKEKLTEVLRVTTSHPSMSEVTSPVATTPTPPPSLTPVAAP